MRAVRQGLVTWRRQTSTRTAMQHTQTKDPLQVCLLSAKVKTFVFPQNPCYNSNPHGGQINNGALGED